MVLFDIRSAQIVTFLIDVFITFLFSPIVYGQEIKSGALLDAPDYSDKRIALLVGNENYQGTFSELANPVNDVRLVSEALTKLNFKVDVKRNLTRKQMLRTLRKFRDDLIKTKGTGLFYYAGHGLQVSSENYLIPTDASPKDIESIVDDSVSLRYVLDMVRVAGNPANIIIIDACRNNPTRGVLKRALQTKSLYTAGMLGFVDRKYAQTRTANIPVEDNVSQGEVIIYSTLPGAFAFDSAAGIKNNSPFAYAFVQSLTQGDINKVIGILGRRVYRRTNGAQTPRNEGSIYPTFYFSVPIAEKIKREYNTISKIKSEKIRIRRLNKFKDKYKNHQDPHVRLASYDLKTLLSVVEDNKPAIVCKHGQVATGNLCCWPGQFEKNSRCRGLPNRCPSGLVIDGETCKREKRPERATRPKSKQPDQEDQKREAKRYAELGGNALIDGDLSKASRFLRACIKLSPDEPECHRSLGIMYASKGSTKNAIRHYQRYIALRPDAPDVPQIKEIIELAK